MPSLAIPRRSPTVARHRRAALIAGALAGAAPTRARADADAAPTPTDVAIAGYVEAYYQAHLQAPSNHVTAQRAFDGRNRTFVLANAVLDVTATRGRVGARIALQTGTTGAGAYQGEPNLPAVGGAAGNDGDVWRHLQLATMTIAAPRQVAIEAGLFPSPIGLEVIPVKDGWTWSRSNLFVALPAYHAGINVSRRLGAGVTARLHAWNGWNAALDADATPTVGASIAHASATTSAQLLYVAGVERAPGAAEGRPVRHVLDAYVQRALSPSVSLAGHADAGLEAGALGTSRWAGGAACGRVALSRTLAVAARVDAVREWRGHATAGDASSIVLPTRWVASATTALSYAPLAGMSLRTELRHDQAADPIFFGGDVAQAQGRDVPTRRQQTTVTVGATAWF